MAHVNRRIGKSSETARDTADGTGGGVLDAFIHDYFNRSGNVPSSPGEPPSAITATGGVISDYTAPDGIYRAHIFTSSGSFDVTELGNIDNNVEYIVVAGGGGSGLGGGGAGGLKSNSPEMPSPRRDAAFPVSTSPGSYTVTIGAGGASGQGGTGQTGANSVFGSITANGGGWGGGGPVGSPANTGPGGAGGSGGGGGHHPGGGGYAKRGAGARDSDQ